TSEDPSDNESRMIKTSEDPSDNESRIIKTIEPFIQDQNIEYINLGNQNIQDFGVQKLAQYHFPCLTQLILSQNNIGAEGAKGLGQLVNLQKLYLSENNIGDEGAKALVKLVNLKELHLENNNIGAE